VKFVDRFLPFAGLGLLLIAVSALASLLVLRSVHADIAEVLWGVGSEVMRYPGAAPEAARSLQINGAQVSFRTQTIDAPLEGVLAHYESLCVGRDAGLIERLSLQASRNDEAGYVACLDLGDASRDLRSLSNRLLQFAETGDLAQLGALRYVRARRVSGDAEDKTFLLSVWTDSAFNLFQMLPLAGADGGGSDLTGVPRPPGSQRVLSAREAGQPSGVVVYRVFEQSAAELTSFYRTELSKRGWTIIERHPAESISIDGIRMISAEQGNRMVTVLSHSVEASQTVLSILSILSSEPS